VGSGRMLGGGVEGRDRQPLDRESGSGSRTACRPASWPPGRARRPRPQAGIQGRGRRGRTWAGIAPRRRPSVKFTRRQSAGPSRAADHRRRG
jgi:hypothetical protein